MYEETGPDGRRLHTVAQIAAEFGVTRPTIYRHLAQLSAGERPAVLTDQRPAPSVDRYDELLTRPAAPPSVESYDQLLTRVPR